MSEGKPCDERDVFRFIEAQIDTIPHLEALLLLWHSKPEKWSEERLSERLFVGSRAVSNIMQDLVRRRLVATDSSRVFWYEPDSGERDKLVLAVSQTYRHELVRVTHVIHAKAPSGVREFARAFKLTRE